jgi:hypothetical protein
MLAIRVGGCTWWLLVIATVPYLWSLHEMNEWMNEWMKEWMNTSLWAYCSVCPLSCSNPQNDEVSYRSENECLAFAAQTWNLSPAQALWCPP